MSARARFNPPTEDDLREFIDLSLNFLCIADTEGYFKHVNPAWEATFGYTKEEVLSRPYLEFVHPDDREATIVEARRLHLAAAPFLLRIDFVVRTGPTDGYFGRRLSAMRKDSFTVQQQM